MNENTQNDRDRKRICVEKNNSLFDVFQFHNTMQIMKIMRKSMIRSFFHFPSFSSHSMSFTSLHSLVYLFFISVAFSSSTCFSLSYFVESIYYSTERNEKMMQLASEGYKRWSMMESMSSNPDCWTVCVRDSISCRKRMPPSKGVVWR